MYNEIFDHFFAVCAALASNENLTINNKWLKTLGVEWAKTKEVIVKGSIW